MDGSERREFSRVDAYVSLHVRAVPQEGQKELLSRISAEPALSQFASLPDLEDKALAETLRIINAKLDAILNVLMFHDKELYALQTNYVNISGSGLSFDSNDPYELETLVEIRMVFPETPDTMICVYGKVVKSEQGEGGFRVSVRFTVIDEEIRDKIVKYVFDKQRELIRKSRRQ